MSKTTIAIVTGAASGIGRATAKILKDRGCTVFCCDSNQVLLEEQFGPVDEEDVGPGGAGAVTNGSAASVPFSSPKHGGSAPNSPGRCNGNPLTGVCFSVVLDVTSASSLRAARDRISEIIKVRWWWEVTATNYPNRPKEKDVVTMSPQRTYTGSWRW